MYQVRAAAVSEYNRKLRYDPASIVGDMVFVETIRPQDYTVNPAIPPCACYAVLCTNVRLTAFGQVRVSSLKFGDSLHDAHELLQFSQPTVQATVPPINVSAPRIPVSPAAQSLAGIVDSGTSCLVFPGHNVHGYLKRSPFALFSALTRCGGFLCDAL